MTYGLLYEYCDSDEARADLLAAAWPDVAADETGYVADKRERVERLAQAYGGDGEVVIVDG